ncbi:MAG: Smr/MutS family protein [bacterium]
MSKYAFENIPQIDLHPWCHDAGGDVSGAIQALRLFLIEQLVGGEKSVEIIHGKGAGYLRDQVHLVLDEYKLNQLVLNYEIHGFNTGSTLAHLPVGRKHQQKPTPTPRQTLQLTPFTRLAADLQGLLAEEQQAEPEPAPTLVNGVERLSASQMTRLEDWASRLAQQRLELGGAPKPLSILRGAPKVVETYGGEIPEYSRAELDAMAAEALAASGEKPLVPGERTKVTPVPREKPKPFTAAPPVFRKRT